MQMQKSTISTILLLSAEATNKINHLDQKKSWESNTSFAKLSYYGDGYYGDGYYGDGYYGNGYYGNGYYGGGVSKCSNPAFF